MQHVPNHCRRRQAKAPLALLLSMSLGGLLAAQADAPAPTAAQVPLEGAFRAPLHREDGAGNALWGSHDAYKVRVDAAGATFTPALGADRPHNLPLRWQTRAFGAQPATEAQHVVHSEWRVELRHGNGVTEAYDLRADGLEQTFVFASAPPLPTEGDYCIEGTITTPLRAAPRRPAHAPIAFRDLSGEEVVRYGAAVAFDAYDRRLLLATSFDGERMRIHVPSGWLRSAAYPVVVDPLLSRETISVSGTLPVYSTQVAVGDSSDEILIGYNRAISASDYDTFTRRTTLDFTQSQIVYVESSNDSSRDTSVAWSKYDDVWLIAMGMQNAQSSWVRVRIEPTSTSSLPSGTTVTVPQTQGHEHQRPVIAGHRYSVPRGYVVFERDAGFGQPETNATAVYGALIDTSNGTIASPTRLSSPGTLDAQRPSICHRADYDDRWFVAWQERNPQLPNDDWDIGLCRIDQNGAAEPPQSLPIDNSNGLHSIQPKVDSVYGEYGVAFLTVPVTGNPVGMAGTRLRLQRFNILSTGVPTSFGATDDLVASEATARLVLHDANRCLAINEDSSSHAAVTWRRNGDWANGVPTRLMAARYGYESAPLEVVELESSTGLIVTFGSASVIYDRNDDGFAISYHGTALTNNAIWGRRLDMPDAQSIQYGGSCAGTLSTTTRPWAGTKALRFRLSGAIPNAASWLWASLGQANLPLPGLTLCPVLLDPTAGPVIVDQDFAAGSGTAFFWFDVPATGAGLDIYWQAMQLDLGNLFAMSNAVRTEIR